MAHGAFDEIQARCRKLPVHRARAGQSKVDYRTIRDLKKKQLVGEVFFPLPAALVELEAIIADKKLVTLPTRPPASGSPRPRRARSSPRPTCVRRAWWTIAASRGSSCCR